MGNFILKMQPQVIAPAGATVVVVNQQGPYQEQEIRCCCCFPMMCGIFSIAAWGLINIYNMINAIGIFGSLPGTAGVIGMVVVILVYLPEIIFYFFVIKYMMGGDTIENRRGVVIGMRCLVANAFLAALAIIIFAGIIGGGIVIFVFVIVWGPLVVLGLFLTWWMMTCKDWYHELVKVENQGQIPADKRL